jgi:hypothetical protein
MSSRIAKWAGVALTVAALIGLSVYFTVVGLDQVDKLASVLGALAGLAGLALAIYGALTNPRPTADSLPDPESPVDPTPGPEPLAEDEPAPMPSRPTPSHDEDPWPEFDVVLRGMDRYMVDQYIELMRSNPSPRPDPPSVPIRWRGYDRYQVNRYLLQRSWPPLGYWTYGFTWSR